MPQQGEVYGTEVERIVEMRRRDADARRQREREVDVHIEAISRVRGEIESKIQEYQDLCLTLQRSIRLVGSTEVQAHYRTFATMQIRMAGAMSQALLRARSMDRVVSASKAEAEDRRRVEEHERSAVSRRNMESNVAKLWLPQADDMEFLYGEEEAEVVNA
jgi:hypothetical protein